MEAFLKNGNTCKVRFGKSSAHAIVFRLAAHFLCVFTMFLSLLPGTLYADTKVDGFFRENLLDEGFFEDNEAIQAEQQKSGKPESFFISREERRRNPDKAPSNSIKVERQAPLIVRQRVYYPYRTGVPFWRGNLWDQFPKGQANSQNYPLGTPPQPPGSLTTGSQVPTASSPVPSQSPIFP